MGQAPQFRTDRIRVVAGEDPRPGDHPGFDPRSRYVERYWLGILGPATTLFLRRAAAELDRAPDGWWMDVAGTARSLGLVSSSRHAPFQRALGRACTFGLASALDPSMIAVRRRLPPLTLNQLARLPEDLRVEHDRQRRDDAGARTAAEIDAVRVGELARALLELGESLEEADAQLARWQVDQRTRQQALFEAYQDLDAA